MDRETLSYRIRDAEVHKVPYMAVIGEREVEADTVAIRRRGAGKKQEVVDRAEFVSRVKSEIESRALT
jgi:threonyl-tRNA synthetase